MHNPPQAHRPIAPPQPADVDTIVRDANLLGARITALREELFSPREGKTLRAFSAAEAAKMLGLAEPTFREMVKALEPKRRKTRTFALSEIDALRATLSGQGARGAGRPPGAAAQTIAVANFKGGSGKTTTTVHLAQHLAMRGFKVLAVDLDPQASLSTLLGHQPEVDIASGETLYGAIRYEDPCAITDVIRTTYFRNLDLIASNLELQEFEHETPRALMAHSEGQTPFFARVAAALDDVAMDYDVILIDCPPQLGFLTLSALCAATGVLLTVHPQMLDVASMSQFLLMAADLMSVVRDAGAAVDLDFFRYVLTRHEPQDGPQTQVVSFLRHLFGDRVLENAMVKSTAIADAGLTKQTLYEVGREGMTRSTYDRAMESLDAVNGEIEDLIRSVWSSASPCDDAFALTADNLRA